MADPHAAEQSRLARLLFHQSDAQLLKRLREELETDEQRTTLARVLGSDEPFLLDALIQQGISAENLAAIRVVPLVAVAWSNNVVYEEERQRILGLAGQNSVFSGTPAHELLREWLTHQPSPGLLDAWKEYVQTVCGSLSPQAVEALRQKVLNDAEEVAKAAGGAVGIGKIDDREAAVLSEVRFSFPS